MGKLASGSYEFLEMQDKKQLFIKVNKKLIFSTFLKVRNTFLTSKLESEYRL